MPFTRAVLPTVDEIRGFWRLFYTKGVLLSKASKRGKTDHDFHELSVNVNGDIELIANREHLSI